MVKTYPIGKVFRVSQGFGDDPDRYEAFGLNGHNGVDFAAPVGTAVYSVDAGVVIEIGFDPNGFGHFVKVDHQWGESLYAHLSTVVVNQWQIVGAGQKVGLSGNSGLSTGPHLHWGVRVKPYEREDGWAGYSDGEPLLFNLDHKPLYPIGPHLAGRITDEMIQALVEWEPATILILDPDQGTLKTLRTALPATKIVARIYKPDGEVAYRINKDPEEAARWMNGIIVSRPDLHNADYWHVNNEVMQGETQGGWEGFQKLVRSQERLVSLATEADYKVGVMVTSVGNLHMPKLDRMGYHRATANLLQTVQRDNHVMLIHEYGAPDLWNPDGGHWHAFRYVEQVISRWGYVDKELGKTRRVKTLKHTPVISSEFGIDHLIYGQKKGWRGTTTAEDFAAQLHNSVLYTQRWPQLLGRCVYTMGHAHSEWASYDIWPEVVPYIIMRAKEWNEGGTGTIPPPPIQPPSGIKSIIQQAVEDAPETPINETSALTKWAVSKNTADRMVWQVTDEVRVVYGNKTYFAIKARDPQSTVRLAAYVEEGKWDMIVSFMY